MGWRNLQECEDRDEGLVARPDRASRPGYRSCVYVVRALNTPSTLSSVVQLAPAEVGARLFTYSTMAQYDCILALGKWKVELNTEMY